MLCSLPLGGKGLILSVPTTPRERQFDESARRICDSILAESALRPFCQPVGRNIDLFFSAADVKLRLNFF